MAEVMINGPSGRLEARYHHSKNPNAPMVLVLHPHPEYGGNMNNKVTYALFRSFVDLGFSAMRFNFRGVGKSEGRFDGGESELADAASVVDWLQAYHPYASACWVAGFSFGAWIGMQLLMRRPEFDGFISAAPPANMFDFSFLAPCPVSGLILQGTKDVIVPKEAVDRLQEKLSLQKNLEVAYSVVPGADHFFTNKLQHVVQEVKTYVSKSMAGNKPRSLERQAVNQKV